MHRGASGRPDPAGAARRASPAGAVPPGRPRQTESTTTTSQASTTGGVRRAARSRHADRGARVHAERPVRQARLARRLSRQGRAADVPVRRLPGRLPPDQRGAPQHARQARRRLPEGAGRRDLRRSRRRHAEGGPGVPVRTRRAAPLRVPRRQQGAARPGLGAATTSPPSATRSSSARSATRAS